MKLYDFCFISKLVTSEILSDSIENDETLEKFVKNIKNDLLVKEVKSFKSLLEYGKITIKYFNFLFSYIYGENSFNDDLSVEDFLDAKVKARKLFYDTVWDKKTDFVKMDMDFDNYFSKNISLSTKTKTKKTEKPKKVEKPKERVTTSYTPSTGYTSSSCYVSRMPRGSC